MKKTFVTLSIVAVGITFITALSLNACAHQTQAETIPPTTQEATAAETSAPVQTEATTEANLDIKVNVPTTEVDVGNGPEVAEVLETYSNGSYSGQLENGDTFTKLNLPILSTGKQFDEMEAMAYEAVYGNWEAQSDENRAILGREGLYNLVQPVIATLTEQEANEVTDYILNQLPIPEVVETQPTETKQAPEESLPEATKPVVESKPVESKPAPKVEPTQSTPVQQPELNPNTNANEGLTPEQIAADEEFQRQLEEASKNGGSTDIVINPGEAGYDNTGEINIGGGN